MTTTSPILRKLVVSGATGKQGGALIQALLSKPTPSFEIYAITRNKTSASAQRLASSPNVHIIEGDFSNPAAIFNQIREPWGLFSVTMPANAKKEEAQGKAMTAAAISAGVKHIVFTATDRGGQTSSDNEPTPIPHFASKYHIEKDIIAQATQQKDLTYTFLRPVAFMDNLTNDFIGKAFASCWRVTLDLDTKLQLIGTKDIGRIAAEAFLNADSPEYKNQAISLAGDDITLREAIKVFEEVTGKAMPETYGFVARILKFLLHEQLGIMFDWFKSTGFGADMGLVKKRYPFVKDFRAWLETESALKKV